MNPIDPHTLKNDFPMLAASPALSYLDSASSSQTPTAVLDAVDAYYRTCRANVHRGMYAASEQATDLYEGARAEIARFVNAEPDEIILTKGTTDSLNLVARAIGDTLGAGDEVVLTAMEHHANLVPWQQAALRRGFTLKVIPHRDDLTLDMDAARTLIGPATKVVAVVWTSNVLGTVNPVADLIALAKAVGAVTIIDAAQTAGHLPIDVKALDCDFLAFSGHKMFGPTGIGALYGKRKRLEAMEPIAFGGDMIRDVTWERSVWNDVPMKFEPGTPNIAGAIGLAAAVRYVQRIGVDAIHAHEEAITRYATEKLAEIPGVRVWAPPDGTPRVGVASLTVDGVHPHDLVTLLDRKGVAVRGGHHCAMPLVRGLGLSGTARASFSVYTTREDIDRLADALRYAKSIFSV
jgi:cysteine desulfurase / selenocysteine lyase